MNFLRGVRQKLANVGDDVSHNFQQLKSTLTPGRSRADSDLSDPSFSTFLIPGGELLLSYQTLWSQLHQVNEDTAKAAARTDKQIEVLASQVNKSFTSISNLQRELSELPKTLASLECIQALADSVDKHCQELDEKLCELEDQVEWCELRRNQHQHNYQLLEYSRRRSEELDKCRVRMAHEHAAKVQRLESARQGTLKERYHTFEEEFQRDLEFYKLHGKTERDPSVSSSHNALDLSDLTPPLDEQDPVALNEFLENNEDDEEAVFSDEAIDSANPEGRDPSPTPSD